MTNQRPYRGLTKDGKWVKGWYCFVPERKYTVYKGKETVSARHFIIDADETEQCFVRGDEEDGFVYDVSEAHEVIPETVGHSTGKNDEKRTEEFPQGQEIFEGDTVRVIAEKNLIDGPFIDREPFKAMVFWESYMACYFYEEVEYSEGGHPLANCKCEVTGSIHDHLLKGAE